MSALGMKTECKILKTFLARTYLLGNNFLIGVA